MRDRGEIGEDAFHAIEEELDGVELACSWREATADSR